MDVSTVVPLAGAVGLLMYAGTTLMTMAILRRRQRRELPCRHHRQWRRETEALKRASTQAVTAQADQTERWVRAGGPLPEDIELWMRHSYGSWQRTPPPS